VSWGLVGGREAGHTAKQKEQVAVAVEAVKRTRKVLVVDDEEAIRRVTAALLELSGFEVLVARNGREALEIANDQAIDLVLTDVCMPAMSGLELGATLAERKPALPVVYMSGHMDRRDLARGSQAGYFVQKPFSLVRLVESLNDALAGTRLAS